MTHHDIRSYRDVTARHHAGRTPGGTVPRRTENTVDFLVRATPTAGLLELPSEERDELMTRERAVATSLIDAGTITWMWRLPDTGTSVTIWNAESVEALRTHLGTLPVFPYNVLEITALGTHPAFPTPLRAVRGSA
jgi:muconolactone D-isomerase